MEIEFEKLSQSDLYVDCIYKGGKAGNISDEPFHLLIPECENAGGFRKRNRQDGSGEYAYVVKSGSLYYIRLSDSASAYKLNLITNEISDDYSVFTTDKPDTIYYITNERKIR